MRNWKPIWAIWKNTDSGSYYSVLPASEHGPRSSVFPTALLQTCRKKLTRLSSVIATGANGFQLNVQSGCAGERRENQEQRSDQYGGNLYRVQKMAWSVTPFFRSSCCLIRTRDCHVLNSAPITNMNFRFWFNSYCLPLPDIHFYEGNYSEGICFFNFPPRGWVFTCCWSRSLSAQSRTVIRFEALKQTEDSCHENEPRQDALHDAKAHGFCTEGWVLVLRRQLLICTSHVLLGFTIAYTLYTETAEHFRFIGSSDCWIKSFNPSRNVKYWAKWVALSEMEPFLRIGEMFLVPFPDPFQDGMILS